MNSLTDPSTIHALWRRAGGRGSLVIGLMTALVLLSVTQWFSVSIEAQTSGSEPTDLRGEFTSSGVQLSWTAPAGDAAALPAMRSSDAGNGAMRRSLQHCWPTPAAPSLVIWISPRPPKMSYSSIASAHGAAESRVLHRIRSGDFRDAGAVASDGTDSGTRDRRGAAELDGAGGCTGANPGLRDPTQSHG